MASKKDIREISELIRKKLEHYMNVERRESRFDPRGPYRTTARMHKYDFLYKVLDSAVLDAERRASRRKSRSPERPKTSVKSPERSATARNSKERGKSGPVRPSYSPRRDRRTGRRIGSPLSEKRRKKDERPRPLAENVAGSQDSLHSGGRRNEDSQKPVGKVQPAKSNDQSLASSNENPADTSTSRNYIRPHLDTSSRRVVLHRENERLANYAEKIFKHADLMWPSAENTYTCSEAFERQNEGFECEQCQEEPSERYISALEAITIDRETDVLQETFEIKDASDVSSTRLTQGNEAGAIRTQADVEKEVAEKEVSETGVFVENSDIHRRRETNSNGTCNHDHESVEVVSVSKVDSILEEAIVPEKENLEIFVDIHDHDKIISKIQGTISDRNDGIETTEISDHVFQSIYVEDKESVIGPYVEEKVTTAEKIDINDNIVNNQINEYSASAEINHGNAIECDVKKTKHRDEKRRKRDEQTESKDIMTNDAAKKQNEKAPDPLQLRQETTFLEAEADEIFITEADATKVEGKESMFTYELDDVTVILYIDNEKLAKNQFHDPSNAKRKRKPRPIAKLDHEKHHNRETDKPNKLQKQTKKQIDKPKKRTEANLKSADVNEPDNSWTDISELEETAEKDVSETQAISQTNYTDLTVTESSKQVLSDFTSTYDISTDVTRQAHIVNGNEYMDFTEHTTNDTEETSTFTQSEWTSYEKHVLRQNADETSRSENDNSQETAEIDEDCSETFDSFTTEETSKKTGKTNSHDVHSKHLRKSSLSDIEDLPSEKED